MKTPPIDFQEMGEQPDKPPEPRTTVGCLPATPLQGTREPNVVPRFLMKGTDEPEGGVYSQVKNDSEKDPPRAYRVMKI